MHYLLLIYSQEGHWTSLPQDEQLKLMGEYNAFTDSIKKSGHWRAGEALHPTSTARSIRVRDGKVLSTDGPFAETKEQLGGFYWVDVKDQDEAAEIAARIPGAKHGCIEIRPIYPTH
jgi:hypothetical protein